MPQFNSPNSENSKSLRNSRFVTRSCSPSHSIYTSINLLVSSNSITTGAKGFSELGVSLSPLLSLILLCIWSSTTEQSSFIWISTNEQMLSVYISNRKLTHRSVHHKVSGQSNYVNREVFKQCPYFLRLRSEHFHFVRS